MLLSPSVSIYSASTLSHLLHPPLHLHKRDPSVYTFPRHFVCPVTYSLMTHFTTFFKDSFIRKNEWNTKIFQIYLCLHTNQIWVLSRASLSVFKYLNILQTAHAEMFVLKQQISTENLCVWCPSSNLITPCR